MVWLSPITIEVGATPAYVEVPRDHCMLITNQTEENKARKPHGADPKWRFVVSVICFLIL